MKISVTVPSTKEVSIEFKAGFSRFYFDDLLRYGYYFKMIDNETALVVSHTVDGVGESITLMSASALTSIYDKQLLASYEVTNEQFNSAYDATEKRLSNLKKAA